MTTQEYLEVAKVFDIIEVLDILLFAKISQNIHIAISTFITCENVMIRNDDNLFAIPDLEFKENKTTNMNTLNCQWFKLRVTIYLVNEVKHNLK